MKMTSFKPIFGIYALLICIFLQISAVRAQAAKTAFLYPTGKKAGMLISTDPADDFFRSIQPLDMRLQMKIDNDSIRPEDLLTAYKDYLKSDLMEFTTIEIERLDAILANCRKQIDQLNPKILPDTVFILKLKGICYGPSAFYTRQNAILIPAPMMQVMDDAMLQSVMYHELFHIISRYEPDLRKAMYALIGFSEIERDMDIPKPLLDLWLLNPDGLTYPVVVELNSPDGRVLATPVIYSTRGNYESSKPQFFQYLQFRLYEVRKNKDQSLTILTDEEGMTTLSGEWIQRAYMDKIKDNTQYIIHPDEVLADNFSYLYLPGKEIDQFSEDGRKLLADLRSIIRKW